MEVNNMLLPEMQDRTGGAFSVSRHEPPRWAIKG